MNEIVGPVIRALAPNEWPTYKRLRLAESPDAFGRTLADEETRADVEWPPRLASTAGIDLTSRSSAS
jgi:hypothetical protein